MIFTPRDTGSAPGMTRGSIAFDNPMLKDWRWPVLEIEGHRPGPRLCVMAGMHVNEVSSIEAAVRLQRWISPERLSGTLSILPILNLPALPLRSQYVCPIDGLNINFSFPGNARGSFSEALADAVLNEWAADADVLVDLHGGDLCENVAKFSICQMRGESEYDAKSQALAKCFDAEIIAALDPSNMAGPSRACTARARSRRHAVMAEAGANGILDEVSIAFHLDGTLNVMRLMKMIDEPLVPAARNQTIVDRYLWITAKEPGMLYAHAEPGMRVSKGQCLATIKNTYGETLAEILAPEGGLVLWRINHGMATAGEKILGLGVPAEAGGRS